MKQAEFEQQLIELVYEATLNPLSFDRFAQEWVKFLFCFDVPSTDLIGHIEQANNMLIQFAKAEQINAPDAPGQHLAMFQVDSNGHPHSANAAALSLTQGANVGELLETAREIAGSQEQKLARVEVAVNGSDNITLIVSNFSRHRIEKGSALVSANQILWPPNFDDLLKDQFGLSKVEANIVRALVEGKTTRQIAEIRSRSFETIRTQVRAILKKFSVESQLDLVRTILGLLETAASNPVKTGPNQLWGPYRKLESTMGPVAYLDFGPRQGSPLLFLLDSEFETELPNKLLKELVNNGRRIIVPKLFPGQRLMPEFFSQLFGANEADRNVQAVASGLNAAGLLTLNSPTSGLIDQLVAINVPANRRQVTDGATPSIGSWMHLLIMLTAAQNSSIFEYMVRARRSYISRFGEDEYLRSYFSPSRSDSALLASGFRIKQLDSATEGNGLASLTESLQDRYASLEAPVDAQVDAYLMRGSDTIGIKDSGTSVQGAGLLLMHTHPAEVVEAIQRTLP